MGSYDELAAAARSKLHPAVWSYYEAGARDEITRDEATQAWQRHRIAPRVLTEVGAPNVSTTILGHEYACPIGIAPSAMQRMADDAGELAMLDAAAGLGAPICIPFLAGHRFADIGRAAADVAHPWWLQVYVPHDRAAITHTLQSALAAGASALVLTADTPVVGTKPKVVLEEWPTDLSPWHGINLPSGPPSTSLSRWSATLGFETIEWLRTFGVPVVVKGVLRGDDANRCVDAGADAVWVSTHGGRQLDRTVSSAAALPQVRSAIGQRAQVFVDGGVRSGLDCMVAMALGAEAVFVGRPPLYALAHTGRDGVEKLLQSFRDELVDSMLLSGARSIADCVGLLGDEGA